MTPATWPYDVQNVSAAKAWCCAHADCGGVTQQHGRYEVRAGNAPIKDVVSKTLIGSWRRHLLNATAMMKCGVEAELNFTLNRLASSYATRATTERTLPLSSELLRKYARFFAGNASSH